MSILEMEDITCTIALIVKDWIGIAILMYMFCFGGHPETGDLYFTTEHPTLGDSRYSLTSEAPRKTSKHRALMCRAMVGIFEDQESALHL